MRAVAITDGSTTFDLLTRRLEKSVQETCKHESERMVSSASGAPADTAINTLFCPKCERYRTEELTMAEMSALEDEAKGRQREV